jgi:hypothetical protein
VIDFLVNWNEEQRWDQALPVHITDAEDIPIIDTDP